LVGLGRVAFLTLLERKLLGLRQLRLGPNKVSYFGVLQPVADGVKLLFKDSLIITGRQSRLYILSPFILLIIFFIVWTWLLPWEGNISTFKYSSLIFFSLLGLGTYAVILTGWSSTRAFSKLGKLRGMLQHLSFEVALILLFLIVLTFFKRFRNKTEEFSTLEFTCFWSAIWCLLSLIETNRAPFDLIEGERELIRGFNVEIGRLYFVYLFLREYGIIIVISFVWSLAIFGKIIVISLWIVAFLLFLRSCFPRIRYDVIIIIIWQTILPFTIFFFFIGVFIF